MNLFYKRKVIHELTYSDGDFSVSWSEMESHLHTPINGCGVGYFEDFPYPKERDSRIDEYLIKKGVAIRNRDGDLEVTEKTSEFIERFNELLNNICDHENEVQRQGDGFVYTVCGVCGEDLD